MEILDGEPISHDGLTYKYKVRRVYQPFKVHKKIKAETPPPKMVDTTPKSRGSSTGMSEHKLKFLLDTFNFFVVVVKLHIYMERYDL